MELEGRGKFDRFISYEELLPIALLRTALN